MASYASIKGSNRPCNGIRVVRMGRYRSGSNLRQKLVLVRHEEFEFKPVRTFRSLDGSSYTYPAEYRRRPVYRLVTFK